MANMLESLGLEFPDEKETLTGLVKYTVSEGKQVVGYYGTPYFNMPAGAAEFWAGTEKGEGNSLSVCGFHTHCRGNTVWEMVCNGIDLSPKQCPKTERILMMNRSTDNGGMLPVDIITADVVPSYLKGEKIKLQVVALCLEISYYATDEEFAASVPADARGEKWFVADGALLPLSFLSNHIVGSGEEARMAKPSCEDDAYVTFKAKVTKLYYGTFEIGGHKENTFIRCFADTLYGELEFIHSLEQVPEELRKNIEVGAVISGICIISADAAIDEYESGIVKDFDHDLRLLRYTLEKGEAERLRSVLVTDSVYETDTSGKSYVGPDAIIERLTYVSENHNGKYIAHMAEITEVKDNSPEFPIGTKCIVLADNEEDNYESLAFITVNSEGNISRLKISTDSRYHFRIEKPERVKTPPDDFEIPESVADPVIARARFHGFLDYDSDNDRITADADYFSHKTNAERMLEALEKNPQPDAKEAIDNILGYLFAKAVEQTVNENTENPKFETGITASFSPADAMAGELYTSLPEKQHHALVEDMKLAGQFGNDFFGFMEMTGKTDDEFTDIFIQAAVFVQRIGQIYAENGFLEGEGE